MKALNNRDIRDEISFYESKLKLLNIDIEKWVLHFNPTVNLERGV
jgi:hypothetical protein